MVKYERDKIKNNFHSFNIFKEFFIIFLSFIFP